MLNINVVFRLQLSDVPADISNGAFEMVKQQDNQLTVKIHEGTRSNEVLKFFINQNVTIEGFNEVLPSLNEVFIKLVEGTKITRQFQTVTS